MRDELIQKYLVSLEGKAGVIKSLWEGYLEGDKSALDSIRLHAHSLKGSGGTFGFPEISAAGAALEEANDTEFRDKLVDLLNILGRESSRHVSAGSNDIQEAGPQERKVSRDVLVVERNPENARIISRCVSRVEGIEGYTVAATGAEARSHYKAVAFSLIVLDIVLPDQDGREILREIKQTPGLDSPVLVISGVPSDKIYMECMKIGADQYLSKPFDTDKLLFEATQVIEQYQAGVPTLAPVSALRRAEPKKALQLKGEKILVAEDDEIQGLFIAENLGEEGADVTVVENGRQAIEALETNTFSAVILDGLMPELDGFETLKIIRETPRLKGLPAIMVTAMGSEEDIIRGYQCGADDYILKPFSEDQLVSRIKSLLVMAA